MMLSNRFQTIGNQLFYIFKSFVHGDFGYFYKTGYFRSFCNFWRFGLLSELGRYLLISSTWRFWVLLKLLAIMATFVVKERKTLKNLEFISRQIGSIFCDHEEDRFMTPNFMMKTNFTPLDTKKRWTGNNCCFSSYIPRFSYFGWSNKGKRGKNLDPTWSQINEMKFPFCTPEVVPLQIGFNLCCGGGIFMTKNVPTIIREITLFYHHEVLRGNSEERHRSFGKGKTRSKGKSHFYNCHIVSKLRLWFYSFCFFYPLRNSIQSQIKALPIIFPHSVIIFKNANTYLTQSKIQAWIGKHVSQQVSDLKNFNEIETSWRKIGHNSASLLDIIWALDFTVLPLLR